MPASKATLSYPGCKSCLSKPCDHLRYGGVFPGKFLFVHRRRHNASPQGCPFLPASFDEVRRLLDGTSWQDLAALVEDVVPQLSPEEYLSVRQEHYITDCSDREGRIRFLEALWKADALSAVRVPDDFRTDKTLGAWLVENEQTGR